MSSLRRGQGPRLRYSHSSAVAATPWSTSPMRSRHSLDARRSRSRSSSHGSSCSTCTPSDPSVSDGDSSSDSSSSPDRTSSFSESTDFDSECSVCREELMAHATPPMQMPHHPVKHHIPTTARHHHPSSPSMSYHERPPLRHQKLHETVSTTSTSSVSTKDLCDDVRTSTTRFATRMPQIQRQEQPSTLPLFHSSVLLHQRSASPAVVSFCEVKRVQRRDDVNDDDEACLGVGNEAVGNRQADTRTPPSAAANSNAPLTMDHHRKEMRERITQTDVPRERMRSCGVQSEAPAPENRKSVARNSVAISTDAMTLSRVSSATNTDQAAPLQVRDAKVATVESAPVYCDACVGDDATERRNLSSSTFSWKQPSRVNAESDGVTQFVRREERGSGGGREISWISTIASDSITRETTPSPRREAPPPTPRVDVFRATSATSPPFRGSITAMGRRTPPREAHHSNRPTSPRRVSRVVGSSVQSPKRISAVQVPEPTMERLREDKSIALKCVNYVLYSDFSTDPLRFRELIGFTPREVRSISDVMYEWKLVWGYMGCYRPWLPLFLEHDVNVQYETAIRGNWVATIERLVVNAMQTVLYKETVIDWTAWFRGASRRRIEEAFRRFHADDAKSDVLVSDNDVVPPQQVTHDASGVMYAVSHGFSC